MHMKLFVCNIHTDIPVCNLHMDISVCNLHTPHLYTDYFLYVICRKYQFTYGFWVLSINFFRM